SLLIVLLLNVTYATSHVAKSSPPEDAQVQETAPRSPSSEPKRRFIVTRTTAELSYVASQCENRAGQYQGYRALPPRIWRVGSEPCRGVEDLCSIYWVLRQSLGGLFGYTQDPAPIACQSKLWRDILLIAFYSQNCWTLADQDCTVHPLAQFLNSRDLVRAPDS
ncbi:unnamed protein product, partial [Mycena citricolor]